MIRAAASVTSSICPGRSSHEPGNLDQHAPCPFEHERRRVANEHLTRKDLGAPPELETKLAGALLDAREGLVEERGPCR